MTGLVSPGRPAPCRPAVTTTSRANRSPETVPSRLVLLTKCPDEAAAGECMWAPNHHQAAGNQCGG